MRIASLLLFPARALTEVESKQAKAWIERFRDQGGVTSPTSKFSRDLELTFSRSSGPGGQNVNKVNTKATVRLDLDRAKKWLPEHTYENLTQTPFYAASSNSLVLSSMKHRTQSANSQDCLAKLEETIVRASEEGLQGETSHDKKERVKGLIESFKARTKEEKQRRHVVKAGRGKVALD